MSIHSYSILTSTAIIISILLEIWNDDGVCEIWNNDEGICMKFRKDIALEQFCPNIGSKTAYLEIYLTYSFEILHDDRVS